MRYPLIFLAMLLTWQSSAQYVYSPIPTNGAMWLYQRETSSGIYRMYTDYQLMMNGDDTVINGVSYTKIMSRSVSYTVSGPPDGTTHDIASAPDAYHGGFREDNKRAYILAPGATTEKLLYDYNLQINDTAKFPMGNGIIIAIDTIFTANKLRRRFTLKKPPYYSDPPRYVTEGYGGDHGLDITPVYGGYKTLAYLMTYHYNDEYYCTTCRYLHEYGTPTSVQNTAKAEPAIYPNPFNNELRIKAYSPSTVTLYNMLGIKVLEQNITTISVINTTSLLSGIYWVTIKNEHGETIMSQKLQKQ